jgi:hypothetical protein
VPANEIYDLLFCDDLSKFQPKSLDNRTGWQKLLFGPAQSVAGVATLASDTTAESRVRALAYNWLRAHGERPPKGILLGVVIELPLDQGLDVLAAYADGSVRYINHSGKLAVIEPGGLPEANRRAKTLIELAQPIVDRIGPWEKARLPPPVKPNVRLTFVVSNGLHFGEGPFQAIQKDPLAGPLLEQGSQLLRFVVQKVLGSPRS